MMDYENVRLCAVDILRVLSACVDDNRHEHHGDVVDGVRLALRDAAQAVGSKAPLLADNTLSSAESRRVADRVNAALCTVAKRWHPIDAAALAGAVWYVRYGFEGARPCRIDAAIEQDLVEFCTADSFAAYRGHVETVRAALERLR